MATLPFDGSIDLHSLQNALNYEESINFVTIYSIKSKVDTTQTTATGTHNINNAVTAAAVGPYKALFLVGVAVGQTSVEATTAQLANTPQATHAFDAPQIYVSDALKDVIAFRMP